MLLFCLVIAVDSRAHRVAEYGRYAADWTPQIDILMDEDGSL